MLNPLMKDKCHLSLEVKVNGVCNSINLSVWHTANKSNLKQIHAVVIVIRPVTATQIKYNE